MQVAKVRASDVVKRKMGEDLLLGSFSGRLCAVLRSLHRFGLYKHPATLGGMAEDLSVWEPLSEPVIAFWVPKRPGAYRLICMDGFWRTAQRLLVRDLYSLMGLDNEFDFSRKGGGGEKALVQYVCQHITKGYHWWVPTDIRDCFPSLRTGHFSWLPIDGRLLKNVVFLPKCAKVKIVIPKDSETQAVIEHLKASYPDLDVTSIADAEKVTAQMVRQGLCQGSVLSPLLARAFVGHELRASLGAMKGVRASWVDDLYFGARVREDARAAYQAFKERLLSHPAGPIELHEGKPIKAETRELHVLGYRLEPDNGYGDNPVHVLPGPKRTNRFKNRLTRKLLSIGLDEDAIKVGLAYWRRWYDSQQAWTKVPGYSEYISETLAMLDIISFEHNEPMKGNYSESFSNETAYYA